MVILHIKLSHNRKTIPIHILSSDFSQDPYSGEHFFGGVPKLIFGEHRDAHWVISDSYPTWKEIKYHRNINTNFHP